MELDVVSRLNARCPLTRIAKCLHRRDRRRSGSDDAIEQRISLLEWLPANRMKVVRTDDVTVVEITRILDKFQLRHETVLNQQPEAVPLPFLERAISSLTEGDLQRRRRPRRLFLFLHPERDRDHQHGQHQDDAEHDQQFKQREAVSHSCPHSPAPPGFALRIRLLP